MIQIARSLLLTTLVLGVCSPTSADEKRVRLEDRLSQETCFLISANNVTDLKKRLQGCSYGRLFNDPSLKDAKQQLLALLTEAIKAADLPDGLSFDDLLALPSGEASFAVLKPSGSNIPMVLALEIGESKDTVNKLLAGIAKRVSDDQEYEKIAHAGVDLHVIHNRGDSVDPKVPTSKATVLFVSGSTFVATNLIDESKKLIDNWSAANGKALSSSKAFQYIRKSSAHGIQTPSLFWYLDFNMLIKGALEGSTDFTANMVRGNLPSFGLDEFRAVGGSIEISTTEYDMISLTVGYIDQPTKGLLNVFRFPEAKLELPKWAPAGAIGAATMNWDVESAYTSTRELTNALIGKGNFDRAIDTWATDPNGPRVHVKQDIIDQLTGKLFVVQSPPVIVDDMPVDGPTLLAAELKEVVQARQILARLLDKNADFEARDFGGSRIYTSKDEELALSFTIAHGCVMISDGPALLEATISVEDESTGLLANKRLQRLIKELPANASVISIQETAQQFGVLYEYFKTIGAVVPNGPDMSKLPDFERLRHYFLPSVGFTVPTDEGFIHTGFSLQQTIGE